jgi:hypothetical protein
MRDLGNAAKTPPISSSDEHNMSGETAQQPVDCFLRGLLMNMPDQGNSFFACCQPPRQGTRLVMHMNHVRSFRSKIASRRPNEKQSLTNALNDVPITWIGGVMQIGGVCKRNDLHSSTLM